jgi:hypothetical protein
MQQMARKPFMRGTMARSGPRRQEPRKSCRAAFVPAAMVNDF